MAYIYLNFGQFCRNKSTNEKSNTFKKFPHLLQNSLRNSIIYIINEIRTSIQDIALVLYQQKMTKEGTQALKLHTSPLFLSL